VSRRSEVLALGFAALLFGAVGASASLLQSPLHGQEAAPEYDIKAALIHNFARFTEWPEGALAGSPDELRLGILGPEAALDSMERVLKGKTVGGRRIKLIHGKAPSDFKTCQLVFIAAAEKDQTAALVEAYKGKPVLTIGESEGFAQDGGIINFYLEQNKVKFEINSDAAARAGLRVTKLVSVAPRRLKDR